MKKLNLIQENIFATLAKMIAAFQVEKLTKNLPDDKTVKKALEDMEITSKNTLKIWKDYCRRNPDDPDCKDINKGK